MSQKNLNFDPKKEIRRKSTSLNSNLLVPNPNSGESISKFSKSNFGQKIHKCDPISNFEVPISYFSSTSLGMALKAECHWSMLSSDRELCCRIPKRMIKFDANVG